MNLSLAGRFARRELRSGFSGGLSGGLRGFRIFLACLALGVAAIAAIGSVRAAIETGLAREGSALLGGDAEIEFTYRFATPEERTWMDDIALNTSEIVDFRSMATLNDERALTQVKSVDGAYPLIGNVVLDPAIPLSDALAVPQTPGALPGAVMERVLIDRLGLAIGDTFTLGSQEFRLTATLLREPDNATAGFGLGPRTLVKTAALKSSGLLSPGTLYTTKYRLSLPNNSDLSALKTTTETRFDGSGMRWRDARNGAPGVAMFVERLSAFLVLVGLSGLIVGGVGVSAAVRAYLAQKTNVIAILRTLGADRGTIFMTYALQIGALSLLGLAIGLTLGALIPLLLAPILQSALPVPAVFALYPVPLIEAALYGLFTAALFTLWPLARTEDVRAATLLRDAMAGARAIPPLRYLVATGLILGALIATAGAFSGSFLLTLWTAVGMFGALALLALAAVAIRAMARRFRGLAQGRPTWRWALASIGGPRSEALPVVLSLGLGLSVLAAVGQLDGNLRGAIARDLPGVAPSYFFVDIQKAQMTGFMARLDGDVDVSRVDSAPMLRGRLTHINGQDAREIAGDHWVIRGDRGITYAAAQPDTTSLTAGEWWPEDYSGPPLISFAAAEAEEIGLTLGDKITVNILGRDIVATIASLREVDFSTAGMGFVMTLNPASVAGAPHSFIATVYSAETAEAAILRDLARKFPNITAIRVRDVIARVSDMLSALAAATSWGASATLLTGFLVLIGAAATGERARAQESAILKTLGATRARILTSFLIRSALLGAAAGLVALAAGIAGGWAVTHFVMDTEFAVIWPSALMIVMGGILANLIAGALFAWRPLAARPAGVLRAQQ